MKRLKDLVAFSDDQAYLCSDPSLLKKHNISNPFKCGCVRWCGAGLVSVQFTLDGRYPTTDFTFLKHLSPLDGETWVDMYPKW